jgi:hypothetical protein
MRTPVASHGACATVTNVDVVQVALVGECQPIGRCAWRGCRSAGWVPSKRSAMPARSAPDDGV